MGDHSYDGIKNDLTNYEKFVKSNGFIVLDDYEPNYPQIMKFVDDCIVNNSKFTIFEI